MRIFRRADHFTRSGSRWRSWPTHEQAAEEYGASFALHTYAQVQRQGRAIDMLRSSDGAALSQVEPAAIVNATGAWVDHTLADLGLSSPPLLSGTKGSHFVTRRRELVEALAGHGIYAEAHDGRPVFVLPFGQGVLVGTTDIPYRGDPDAAVASPEELHYLLALVNEVFPQINLTERDIEMHYTPACDRCRRRDHRRPPQSRAAIGCTTTSVLKYRCFRSLAES